MTSDQAGAIADAIDRDELLALTGDLIRIPSFCPEETPVAHFLEAYFRPKGYDVTLQEVEPGRLQPIARLPGSGGGRTLMLNGHMDINSLTRASDRDPWQPAVEGDRIYGAGVQNMKGGLAAMIIAAEAVRRSGVKLRGDLVLACVVGETQGGVGSKYLAESGIRADMAVLPEPMGTGNLLTVHGGIAHFAIHTYGVTGHISQLPRTVNAVQKMTKVIQALQDVKFTFERHELLPDLPLTNVGSVIGGRGQDYVLSEPPYVPDLCTILVDVHFGPGMTTESILADVRRVLDPLAEADPDLKYAIEMPPPPYFRGARQIVMQPVIGPTDSEAVKAVTRAHEAVTGKPINMVGALLPLSYSAGDASWLWPVGIPCVYYGPAGGFADIGAGGTYSSVSEMMTCAKVYARTIVDVLS